jgi:anti-anti-sigma factor
MDQEQLSIATRVDEGVARVQLAGELDVNTAPLVADQLTRLVAEGVTSVVVDVANLTFVDSTGLRAILAGREKLQAEGASLVLEGASGVVERVLDMTGLRGLLASDA